MYSEVVFPLEALGSTTLHGTLERSLIAVWLHVCVELAFGLEPLSIELAFLLRTLEKSLITVYLHVSGEVVFPCVGSSATLLRTLERIVWIGRVRWIGCVGWG